MKPRNDRAELQEEFCKIRRTLLDRSLEHATTVAHEQGMEDAATHVLLTLATAGTTNARQFAEATGTCATDAMDTMRTLEQKGLVTPGTAGIPDQESSWHLTGDGEAAARRILRPYQLSRASTIRTTAAEECCTTWVMPDGHGLAGEVGGPAWTVGPALARR